MEKINLNNNNRLYKEKTFSQLSMSCDKLIQKMGSINKSSNSSNNMTNIITYDSNGIPIPPSIELYNIFSAYRDESSSTTPHHHTLFDDPIDQSTEYQEKCNIIPSRILTECKCNTCTTTTNTNTNANTNTKVNDINPKDKKRLAVIETLKRAKKESKQDPKNVSASFPTNVYIVQWFEQPSFDETLVPTQECTGINEIPDFRLKKNLVFKYKLDMAKHYLTDIAMAYIAKIMQKSTNTETSTEPNMTIPLSHHQSISNSCKPDTPYVARYNDIFKNTVSIYQLTWKYDGLFSYDRVLGKSIEVARFVISNIDMNGLENPINDTKTKSSIYSLPYMGTAKLSSMDSVLNEYAEKMVLKKQ